MFSRSMTMLIIMLVLIASYPSAFAFRPFVTEDADVSQKGEIGFEVGNEFNKNNSSKENVTTLSIIYGLTNWFEVEIDFALLYINPDLGSSEFGLGDTIILTKLKLLGENGIFSGLLNSSFMPELIIEPSFLIPTGNADRGLGSDDIEFGALVGLQKEISITSIKTNFGYFSTNDPIIDQTFDDRFFYGLEIDFPVFREDFTVGTEITGEFGTSDNEQPVFSRTGFVYEINRSFAFDGGFEIGLNDTESSKTIIFGLTISIQPH